MDEELRHHLEETADRLVEQGWSADEARVEAERRMGDMKRWRAETLAERVDYVRRKGTVDAIERLRRDVGYAVRSLRRNPGFSWTFMATLALGIGATGAIFSVVDAVLIRPLPFHEPGRLVDVSNSTGDGFLTDLRSDQVTVLADEASFFDGIATHARLSMVETGGSEARNVGVIGVSPSLGDVLGVHAARGRLFGPDDAIGGARTAVLSWSYWSRRGRDPDVIGSAVELDGERWTVVGVLPESVKYPIAGTVDVWIPIAVDGTVAGREMTRFSAIGRLAEGVDLDAAKQRAEVLGQGMREDGLLRPDWAIRLDPADGWRVNRDTKQGLFVVAGAVGLMFLIAIVNAVNLLLVRSHDRAAEISVRKAIGASRGQVARQVLVESVVLALLGGVVATFVAAACVTGVRAIAPEELTFSMVYAFELEARSLLVVFLAASVAGLLVAPLPAFAAAGVGALGAGSRRLVGRGRAGHRIQSVLVVSQVALSSVLLIGAGLFLRSFSAMVHQDMGIETGRLAWATLDLPEGRYETAADRSSFTNGVLGRLRALPGVESAIVAQGVPPGGGGISFATGLQAEGREALEGEHLIPFGQIGEGYLQTLGARLVAGRSVTRDDMETGGAVVDRDMAELVFGTHDVVGRRFRYGAEDDWQTVVGVVDELKFGGLDDRIGNTVVLRPLDPEELPSYLTFVVRTGDPEATLPGIRASITEADAALPLAFLGTADDALGVEALRPRFLVLLMSVLAAIAIALAAVGVYGVLSFIVRRRQHEVGIRIALGAPLTRIRRDVMSWGLSVAGVGIVLGLVAAARLDDTIEALLFEVSPEDLVTRAVVGVTMVGVVSAACLIPARRATRCDPVETLKANGA